MTHLNPQFETYDMGSSREISWLSDDGELLRGILLLPPQYRKGEHYPLLVWLYGGAFLSDRIYRFGFIRCNQWSPSIFSFLQPEAMLSLGTGFSQHVGTPMLDVGKSVLPAVNKVVEMGIADP